MKGLRRTKSFKSYDSKDKQEINIGIGHLFTAGQQQEPGYLSVKIDNYNLEGGKVKFFGVESVGGDISGAGVTASRIDESGENELIFLFNISKLLKNGQFNERTVEGVITVAGQEIARSIIETNPAIYLG